MTPKDLNRHLLWSQHLSSLASGRGAPVEVADACCGIQSQDLRESLSSFWARVQGFQDPHVLNQLRPEGDLVRTWAIRSTMHTIPSRDYYIYIHGGASERMLKWIDTLAKKVNYPPREERRKLFYEPILEEIQGRAVTQREIRALVDRRAGRRGLKEGVWSGVGDMAFQGLLVHAGKSGFRSLWRRADEWVPSPRGALDRISCRVELLRKYISRYGPVTKEDIRYWSYLTKKQVEEALEALEEQLIEVDIASQEEPYIALQTHFEEDPPPPPRITLLPKYDSLLLALKDKSRFMNMVHYKLVFPRVPVGMVRATVLVDGFVVATWARLRGKATVPVEINPLEDLAGSDRRAIEEKFQEYSEYVGREASMRWSTPGWQNGSQRA